MLIETIVYIPGFDCFQDDMNLTEEKKAPLRMQGTEQKKTMLAMQFKSSIQVGS